MNRTSFTDCLRMWYVHGASKLKKKRLCYDQTNNNLNHEMAIIFTKYNSNQVCWGNVTMCNVVFENDKFTKARTNFNL